MKPLQKPAPRLHTLDVTVSFSASAKLCGNDESLRTGRRREREEMEEACGQKETIHGPLCSVLTLPTGKDGKGTPAAVEFVNPLALLFTLTVNRPAFGDLLRSVQGAGQLTIVLYADEAKPGNVLRPDTGRAQLCIYWTLLELPGWFKSRDCGWWFCLGRCQAACPCSLRVCWTHSLASPPLLGASTQAFTAIAAAVHLSSGQRWVRCWLMKKPLRKPFL